MHDLKHNRRAATAEAELTTLREALAINLAAQDTLRTKIAAGVADDRSCAAVVVYLVVAAVLAAVALGLVIL